jgi:hypothetical protein
VIVTAPQPDTTPGPYAQAAGLYWAAGWRGVLPLPARAKKPVPAGYTGATGADPSYPDVHAWTEGSEGAGNLALRMPHHVIGIDVDDYNGKGGGKTLTDLETAHGVLPGTWRSTSRNDGVSGIRLFNVPEGLAWPGVLGAGIEVIQHRHRYTVAWPSTHPDTGGTYRWINPDGNDTLGVVPGVDDLPDLPHTWIAAITGGELQADIARAQLSDTAAGAWLNDRSHDGTPCPAVTRALARYVADLTTGARARHDTAMLATARLVHLAGEGHQGTTTALAAFKAAWQSVLDHDTTRAADPGEWNRLLGGAVRIAAAAHPQREDGDPCQNPFHGLIERSSTPWQPPAPASPPTAAANGATAPSTGEATPDPSASAPATTRGTDEPAERQRTSWWPRDLQSVFDGTDPEPVPEHLCRDDGQALFYPAKVNGLIGESESGKTWVVLLGVRQALARGQRVTYLDFEDTAAGIVHRLTSLGVNHDQLRTLFRYIGPDQGLDLIAAGDLHEHLAAHAPHLVVVDGFNAAMSLLGLKINDNDDATAFAQRLLKPLAATGAAVVYIDHIPKSRDNETKGGIGAQAKRAMTTGCALRVEVLTAFGIGQTGKLRLRVDKDRPGHVRGASLPGQAGHWAADVTITSDPDTPDVITIDLVAPNVHTPAEQAEFRPTTLMSRVSATLALEPDGLTGSELERRIKGKATAVRQATKILVAEGYAKTDPAPRNGVRYSHVKSYDELADLVSTPSPHDPVPTPSHPVPDGVSRGTESTPSHPVPAPYGVGRDGDGVEAPAKSTAQHVPVPRDGDGDTTDEDDTFCRHCGAENPPARVISNCAHCGRLP